METLEDQFADAIDKLSRARTLEQVMRIVRRSARELSGADGVTFVLRDGDRCYYAEENAIAPLWKGKRFPMVSCISGWVMTNREAVSIPDVFSDPRISSALYRPTFVKSMAMVPVRDADPVAAIGAYWADTHEATEPELRVLRVLADASALALSRNGLGPA
jgi:GAF domain-containing protein